MKKESRKNTINNKLGKISNKIYLQNKYIRNNKELLEVVRESFRGNPAAGQKLLTIVPETKEFMAFVSFSSLFSLFSS